MKQTLAYFKRYIHFGWLATLPFTAALVSIVIYEPTLNNERLQIWHTTWFLILCISLTASLTLAFSPWDTYIVATGAPPRRRLAALILAFTFHLAFAWLAMALSIWLRLRSAFQESKDNLFYPDVAPTDDSSPWAWLYALPVLIVLFLELRLRASNRYNLLASLFFTTLAVFASFGLLAGLEWIPYDKSNIALLLTLASAVILVTRLVNIPFLISYPESTTRWNAPRSAIIRASDTFLIALWACIFLWGSFYQVTSTNIYLPQYETVPSFWPQVLAYHALALAAFLAAAYATFKGKSLIAAPAIMAGVILILFPCQRINHSYLGPHNRNYSGPDIIVTTPLPNAQIIIDGQSFTPQPIAGSPVAGSKVPTWQFIVPRRQFPESNPPLQFPPQPDLSPSNLSITDKSNAQTSRHFKDKQSDIIHKAQVKIGPDLAYIREYYDRGLSSSDPETPEGFKLDLLPTPWELNRRQQPIIAWLLLHPDALDMHALVQKIGSSDALQSLITRLDREHPTNLLPRLQAYVLNDNQPIPESPATTPDQDQRIIQTILTQDFTDLNKPIFQQLVPHLTPDQVARLITCNIPLYKQTGHYGYFNDRDFRPKIIQTLFELWIDTHPANTPARARLQQLLYPTLLAHGYSRNLALLGGPQADRFLRKTASLPQFNTFKFSQNTSDELLLSHPLILGANMPAPEGPRFQADHAPQILDLLVAVRKASQREGFSHAVLPFVRRALGPVDTSPSIREAYWQWYSTEFGGPDIDPKTLLRYQISELNNTLTETRVDPYLKVLENPRTHIPAPPRSNGFSLNDHQSYIWYLYTYNLVFDLFGWGDNVSPDHRRLLSDIMARVVQDPARYGVPTTQSPDAAILKSIDNQINPTPTREPDRNTPADQTAWIQKLLAASHLTQPQKAENLTLAIKNGHVNAIAAPTFASQEQSWARPYAIDAILRWPTPENLTLLASLTTDADLAIASRAKSAQAFITKLKSLPLEKIPDPFTPESIRFFDLPELHQ